MKKRIFTLLALAMLFWGGASSTLKAQTVDSVWIGHSSFPDGEVYEVKVDTAKNLLSTSRTTLSIKVGNPSSMKGDATIVILTSGAADYLGLPASVTVKMPTSADTIYSFNFDHNWNMPNSVNETEGIVHAYVGATPPSTLVGDTSTYYNYPTFNVEYLPTTSQYAGSLKVGSITGSKSGYNYMQRSLQKNISNMEKVFVSFSDVEVANLTYGDKILVMTGWETYVLDIPGLKNEDDIPPGTIQRAVTVPVVSNAILNIESGVHQVASTDDFSFTIKPTGSNEGLIPVVTTGRTDFPDSEGVTYQQLSDGSWLVTIVRIQSNINLSISFTVSNASIESNSVWANGGQLYVSAATSSKASIYSITGALVKTAAIVAGETANISLPTGLYIVSVNGKAYKVTVK